MVPYSTSGRKTRFPRTIGWTPSRPDAGGDTKATPNRLQPMRGLWGKRVEPSAAIRNFDSETELVLLPDPVEQWLDWEQQANLIGFRTDTRPVEVELSEVPRDELEVYVLPGAPAEIVDRFIFDDKVLCARHPLNRDGLVAWSATPADQTWSARFTSSRTLAMHGAESGEALFSLKLATDHPHPNFYQPEKTKLREEAIGAVDWVKQLTRIDALLGPLVGVQLILDVLVVLARGGESGFMVRDLRLFQDGNYSLPALSLPFVGRQIARQSGNSFDTFWAQHYAMPAGLAKARLFARYGMWFETPNPQNLLIRLDPSLHPRPDIVFRDVGDGECATDAFMSADRPWTKLESDLRPETQNSFWAFGEAGEHSVQPAILEYWYAAHDDAYYGELARCFPSLAPAVSVPPAARLDHWNGVLRTPAGEEAVARYFDSFPISTSSGRHA